MHARTNDLRSRRREETRTEIVRTAFELFGRDGYENVSMEAIAAAAGISRATLFNYFQKKELLLRDIAAARVATLKKLLAEFAASGETPGFDRVAALMLKLAEENARIAAHSKKLLLAALFQQASQGLLLAAREDAVGVLATTMRRMPGRRKPPRIAADTLFAVFLATMLEWLMRESAPPSWLNDRMKERLRTLKEGVA